MKTIGKDVTRRIFLLMRAVLPLGWASVIFWLSLMSNPPHVPGIFSWDKAQHLGAYLVLTILIAQFFLILFKNIKSAGWVAVVLAVLFGALLELLQGMMQSGRTPEWLDLAADVLGALVGNGLFRYAAMFLLRVHGGH